jgi:hypothetical protein
MIPPFRELASLSLFLLLTSFVSFMNFYVSSCTDAPERINPHSQVVELTNFHMFLIHTFNKHL